MGYHYRASNERVLFLEKRSKKVTPALPPGMASLRDLLVTLGTKQDPPGKGRQLNNLGIPDTLFAPQVPNGYPTEKPVSLLKLLIQQSTQPDEVVLDPFCGSGSAGDAAFQTGRQAILNDISGIAAGTTWQRLMKLGAVLVDKTLDLGA
jgi:DNA modification methylase